MKPYNLHGVAGLAERTKCPDTGCTVSLYVAEQAGIDSEETWVAVCETHGTMVGAGSRAQGRESMENPEWCEECVGMLEIKMQPNGRHSLNQTVVQYAVQEMFKGKSPAVAARNTAQRLNGGTNMFIDSAHEVGIDPTELEDALWKNMADYATAYPIKPGDERNVARGTLMYFKQWSWGKPPKTKLEDKLMLYMAKPQQHTPNHSAVYYVWVIDYRNVPIDEEGPYGPMSLDRASSFARIGAQNGEHDRAVSVGRNPEAESFEIVRRYRRDTGERVL